VTKREYKLVVPNSLEEVWNFHNSAKALVALTPPQRRIRALVDDLEVRDGALHVFQFVQFGLPMVWKARISEVDPPNGFTDTAEQSPFPFWRHRHAFLEVSEGTLIHDQLEYQAPGGPLSGLIDRLVVQRDLDRLFAFRHAATLSALARP